MKPPTHIAVMHEPFLSAVFDGHKTIESRFSLHRIAPYQTVQPGDVVLMKAGKIVGSFVVQWVQYFDLATANFDNLIHEFGPGVAADTAFWESKRSKRYATFMGISQVRRLSPTAISKTDRRGWVSLT